MEDLQARLEMEPRDGGWRWRSQGTEVGDGGSPGQVGDGGAKRWRISRPGWRCRSQEMEDLQARLEMQEPRDGGSPGQVRDGGQRWRSQEIEVGDGGSPGQVGDAGGKRQRLEMEEPGRQRAELEDLQLHWPPCLRQPTRRQEPALCSSPAAFGYLQTALPHGSPGRDPTCTAVV